MGFHGSSKTGFIHAQATFTAHISGQIKREAKGVVQLEGHLARQHLHATVQRGVQNLHAVFQCFEEALFFGFEHFNNAFFVRFDLGIRLAHQGDQIGHQFVEKRAFLFQLVAMANRATNDAALHITPAFVTRVDAVADQECGGPDVVGDHAQALVVQIGATGFAGGSFDQGVKNIDLVVAVNMLQDGGETLQPHAGVNAGCG